MLAHVGLRGVVNNAGINMHGEIELMTLGLLQRVMDINFFGTVRVTKAFLPLIRKSKGMRHYMNLSPRFQTRLSVFELRLQK